MKPILLIVEDDNEINNLLKRILESQGYEIYQAYSGTEAGLYLKENMPDLILLDYEMPVCDGKQVLEMIRAEKELEGTAVIFLTSRVDRESVKEVLSLKPAGYLSKSLEPAEIKNNIDEYFNRVG